MSRGCDSYVHRLSTAGRYFGATNAQTNLFRINASFTSNTLGPLQILSPTNGVVLASNNPPYFWHV